MSLLPVGEDASRHCFHGYSQDAATHENGQLVSLVTSEHCCRCGARRVSTLSYPIVDGRRLATMTYDPAGATDEATDCDPAAPLGAVAAP